MPTTFLRQSKLSEQHNLLRCLTKNLNDKGGRKVVKPPPLTAKDSVVVWNPNVTASKTLAFELQPHAREVWRSHISLPPHSLLISSHKKGDRIIRRLASKEGQA